MNYNFDKMFEVDETFKRVVYPNIEQKKLLIDLQKEVEYNIELFDITEIVKDGFETVKVVGDYNLIYVTDGVIISDSVGTVTDIPICELDVLKLITTPIEFKRLKKLNRDLQRVL